MINLKSLGFAGLILVFIHFSCKSDTSKSSIIGTYTYKDEILYVYQHGVYKHISGDSIINRGKWQTINKTANEFLFKDWLLPYGELGAVCKDGCDFLVEFHNNVIFLIPDIEMNFIKKSDNIDR